MWRVCGEGDGRKPLGQAGEDGAARAELRRKDAQPGAAANLVDLVEQVDDVKAQFQPLVDPGVDRLNDAEIHLLVAGQRSPVRRPARKRGSETAAGGKVDREESVPGRDLIFDAGRGRVCLVVISVDSISSYKG